jgi:hypothetical protein
MGGIFWVIDISKHYTTTLQNTQVKDITRAQILWLPLLVNSAAAAFQESWDQVSEEDAENMVAIDQKKPDAVIWYIRDK